MIYELIENNPTFGKAGRRITSSQYALLSDAFKNLFKLVSKSPRYNTYHAILDNAFNGALPNDRVTVNTTDININNEFEIDLENLDLEF